MQWHHKHYHRKKKLTPTVVPTVEAEWGSQQEVGESRYWALVTWDSKYDHTGAEKQHHRDAASAGSAAAAFLTIS